MYSITCAFVKNSGHFTRILANLTGIRRVCIRILAISGQIRGTWIRANSWRIRVLLSNSRELITNTGNLHIIYIFPIACFLSTLLPSPRDTSELLGQILIKRNISYWLNTSLFNFDTHKGLTVKIYIILVCTQQQWGLLIFDFIRTPS